MKILIGDIETSLMVVPSFSLWPKYIPHDGILQDWSILGGAWKWLGYKKVHTSYVNPEDPTNDRSVAFELRDALAEADIVVFHNGDKFDIRKINTRVIYHNLPPFPAPKSVDTLKIAKKEFGFTSNRLDYIGNYLGCGGKIHNEKNLWQAMLSEDVAEREKALKKMVKYNKRDVTLLEEVYLKMRPFIRNHPNVNLLIDSEENLCRNCGSSHLQKRGFYVTVKGKYQRYQCQDCGAWTKIGKVVKTTEVG